MALLWFASCLAERNRTPFDFAEGESELVSGFNTEYRGGGFALIFMAEYARILFLRALFFYHFLGEWTCFLAVLYKNYVYWFLFCMSAWYFASFSL